MHFEEFVPHPAGNPSDSAGDDRRKLETLLRIAGSLSVEIRLDPLLRLMVSEVTAAMRAERCTLFVVDPHDPDQLFSRVAAPVEQEIRLRVGEGVAGATAASRQTINLADAYEDPRFNPAFDRASNFRTRSLLSMPILDAEAGLVGVVQVLNKTGGAFSGEDERFLEAIGVHLGLALRRAALVEAYLETQVVAKSLELARGIQQGCLPRDAGALQGRAEVEISAVLDPVYEVGGDLYDYFPLDEHRLCFIMGDVSGKGVPAALFMVMARTAFKLAASARPGMLGGVLAQVNQYLYESNPQSMFVTALAGIVDLRSGRVEYADAGHEPPFLVRASGAVEKVEKEGGMVLGILPGQEYIGGSLELQPGDTLVLYTDGVSEAMNAAGEFYGAEAAQAALAGAGPRAGSGKVLEALREGVRGFAAGARQSDDIAILAIGYRGAARPAG
jgi:serine phosphatase RsbU (regulator of sigma subunit)